MLCRSRHRDLTTFQRALCNAFGVKWIELGMTSAEFREICEPYMSERSKPLQKGEPGGHIMWMLFAQDLQGLADRGRPTDDFMAKLAFVEVLATPLLWNRESPAELPWLRHVHG